MKLMTFNNWKEWQKVLLAFIGSFILLFTAQALLSGIGILAAWGNTPTFYLLVIPGFFFAYFTTSWAETFFETSIVKKPWFLIIILMLSLLAWHIALTFYFQNNVILELKQNQQYQQGQELQFSANCKILALPEGAKRNETLDSFGIASCITGEQYWNQLKESTYLIFVLSAILGWVSNILITNKKK